MVRRQLRLSMKPSDSELIDIAELRIGLYVELDLGWMSHPFPTGSFKIGTLKQIEVIRGLGLKQVRWVPSKSDPPLEETSSHPGVDEDTAARALARDRELRRQRAALIESQPQPWMYEVLACSMELAKRPKAEIERVMGWGIVSRD